MKYPEHNIVLLIITYISDISLFYIFLIRNKHRLSLSNSSLTYHRPVCRYVDEVQLVYQWIPPRVPQALGVLADRINTTFKISGDPWAAHRALFIPRPHPVLSGQYSCTVSTFEDEDTQSAHLLVWSEFFSFSEYEYLHSIIQWSSICHYPFPLSFLSLSAALANFLGGFAIPAGRIVHPKGLMPYERLESVGGDVNQSEIFA